MNTKRTIMEALGIQTILADADKVICTMPVDEERASRLACMARRRFFGAR